MLQLLLRMLTHMLTHRERERERERKKRERARKEYLSFGTHYIIKWLHVHMCHQSFLWNDRRDWQ